MNESIIHGKTKNTGIPETSEINEDPVGADSISALNTAKTDCVTNTATIAKPDNTAKTIYTVTIDYTTKGQK